MEYVVLLDEQGNEIGKASKEHIHSFSTPLHKAFSCFLFNKNGELLLTKRSEKKKAFAGVWTNTCCGHPGPGESYMDAICRRLEQELGIVSAKHVIEVSSYRYCFADAQGIVENEICPIYLGFTSENPIPSSDEVSDWKWIRWHEFLQTIDDPGMNYSPWAREEAKIIQSQGVLPVALSKACELLK